jgi:hypothetical protein
LSSYEERLDITDAKPDVTFFLGFNMWAQTKHQIFNQSRYSNFMSKFCYQLYCSLNDSLILRTDPRADRMLVGAINNISHTFPSFSPLTQPESLRDNLFCDEDSLPESCAGLEICPCVHRLKVKLNSIVELFAVDETTGESLEPSNH